MGGPRATTSRSDHFAASQLSAHHARSRLVIGRTPDDHPDRLHLSREGGELPKDAELRVGTHPPDRRGRRAAHFNLHRAAVSRPWPGSGATSGANSGGEQPLGDEWWPCRH